MGYVRVDPDGTVWATDGCVAVRVRRPNALPDEDFPTVDVPEGAAPPATHVLIPAETAIAVAKTLPKRPPLPILENALLRVTKDRVYLAVTDLEHPQVTTFARAGETFPNIDELFNDHEKKKRLTDPLCVSANYLILVAKYARMFDLGKNCPVAIASFGQENPVSFEWTDMNNNMNVCALVMPVQLARGVVT